MRSRTQSRPSPYPQHKTVKAPASPQQVLPSRAGLREVYQDYKNIPIPAIPSPDKSAVSEFGMRPRVNSTARRSALGWTKKKGAKMSTEMKENEVNISQGSITKT